MFEKLKLILGLAKINKIENEISKAKIELSNAENEMLHAAKDFFSTDVSKMSDEWIKEKYNEAERVLEAVKPYPSDMALAKIVAKYYDFVQELENEIKNRNLNIYLGLAEKYKEEIFK